MDAASIVCGSIAYSWDLKCDEGKPTCAKCLKRGLECQYRDQVHIWFCDQTEEVAERGRKGTASPPRSQAVSKRRTSDEALQISPKLLTGDSTNRSLILNLAVKYCLPEWYLSSRAPEHSAPARYHMWNSMGSYTGAWSPMASIIAALCYTRCSQMTGDVAMRRKGLEMYQNALVAIRMALGRRSTAFEPDTVMAIGIMSIYEALEDATGSKGEMHSSAFVNLIRLMGPEAVASDPIHDIFCICRVHAICQALQQRRTTFFSRPEWLSIPFKTHPKNNYNLLADLVAELCTYLEAADILSSSTLSTSLPISPFTARLSLQSSCLSLRARFAAWATCPSTLAEFPPPRYMDQETARARSPETSGSATASFYIPLEYDKFETAETYLLYWTACLMLSGILKNNNKALLDLAAQSPSTDPRASASPSSTSTSSSSSSSFPPRLKSKYRISDSTVEDFDMATSIAATMDYCLRQDNGLFGVGPVILPLNTAMAWFETQPGCWQRLKWCRDLLKLMPLIQAGQLFRGLRLAPTMARKERWGFQKHL
ncbi:hypothetical protein DL98DRAFT_531282 [Cadophora sp. DSE1049]|nr:hypothetical protein DL98DRAFT_531282 [Cadophora sp. DSE1049]